MHLIFVWQLIEEEDKDNNMILYIENLNFQSYKMVFTCGWRSWLDWLLMDCFIE